MSVSWLTINLCVGQTLKHGKVAGHSGLLCGGVTDQSVAVVLHHTFPYLHHRPHTSTTCPHSLTTRPHASTTRFHTYLYHTPPYLHHTSPYLHHTSPYLHHTSPYLHHTSPYLHHTSPHAPCLRVLHCKDALTYLSLVLRADLLDPSTAYGELMCMHRHRRKWRNYNSFAVLVVQYWNQSSCVRTVVRTISVFMDVTMLIVFFLMCFTSGCMSLCPVWGNTYTHNCV